MINAFMLPIVAGAVLVSAFIVAPLYTGKRWWIGILYGVVSALIIASALFHFTPTGSHIGSLRIVDDVFLRLIVLVVIAAGILSMFLFIDYRKDNPHPSGESVLLILGTTFGALITGMSGDVLLLILGIELSSLPVYVLTGMLKWRGRPIEAAVKYILLGAFATSIMLYGAGLIFYGSGSTSFVQLMNALHANKSTAPLLLGLSFLLVGIAFKASIAPFHMWTPDVYDGSPTPYTAFMSAAIKLVAFTALIRLYSVFAFVDVLRDLLYALAIISMVWGNFAALVQTNVKRMLAYSSVAHAGYILVPLVTGTRAGVEAAIFYLIIYSLSSAAAFGIVAYRESQEGEGVAFKDFSGLALKNPLLGLSMVIIFFALAGVPPTGGFMAKFYAFKAAIDYGYWKLALIGIITSMVGAYYYLQVLVYAYMKEKSDLKLRVKGFTTLGVLIFALLVLAYGIDPGTLLKDIKIAAETALGLFY